MTAQASSTFDPVLSHGHCSEYDAEDFTFNYVYEYNDVFFDILLSSQPPPGYDTANSIESQYLERFQLAGQCEGDDEDDISHMLEESKLVEAEIEKHVLKVCKSTMQKLAPAKESSKNERISLHSCMFPKTFNLQLATKRGVLMAVRRDDMPIHDYHAYITDIQVLAIDLPNHKDSDITVMSKLYPYIYKVNIKGQTMVAKLGRSDPHDSISDEIKKLYRIQTQGPIPRIPQLKGFVSSPKGIVGFLTNYIHSLHHNLEFLLTLTKSPGGAVPKKQNAPPLPTVTVSKERRAKWANQIQETLKSIHGLGIVWGDAKLANVLIDEVTDDAWIVDFGGGEMDGGIGNDSHSSKAGDLQALERIKAELAEV